MKRAKDWSLCVQSNITFWKTEVCFLADNQEVLQSSRDMMQVLWKTNQKQATFLWKPYYCWSFWNSLNKGRSLRTDRSISSSAHLSEKWSLRRRRRTRQLVLTALQIQMIRTNFTLQTGEESLPRIRFKPPPRRNTAMFCLVTNMQMQWCLCVSVIIWM